MGPFQRTTEHRRCKNVAEPVTNLATVLELLGLIQDNHLPLTSIGISRYIRVPQSPSYSLQITTSRWDRNILRLYAFQDAGDFSQFFGGLIEGAEGTYVTGLSPYRIARTVLTMVSSSIVVAVFFAISLALSGLWPVPGHHQATFWTGFMNRLAWAFSPLFLGGFFPGLCNPQMMRDWRIHRYFLVLGLLPFIIANVAFPYVVGTDTHFKASCHCRMGVSINGGTPWYPKMDGS